MATHSRSRPDFEEPLPTVYDPAEGTWVQRTISFPEIVEGIRRMADELDDAWNTFDNRRADTLYELAELLTNLEPFVPATWSTPQIRISRG